MGLFSSKYETYVASSLYNLAGDENLRPNYIASLIVGSRLSGSNIGMGQLLSNAHLNGSGMQQRRFFQWAQKNYFAMPQASVGNVQTVEGAAAKSGLESLLNLGANQTIRINRAVIDRADVGYWAEDYVNQNYPALSEEDWSAAYLPETSQISIETPAVTNYIQAPADFLWGIQDSDRHLLFAEYAVITKDTSGAEVVAQTGPSLFMTYRMGSGNVALDALQGSSESMTEFFPALPLRLDNASVDTVLSPERMGILEKGYKKLSGRKLSELTAMIEDNEQIDDIDFAFLVQGVSLNTKDKHCKEYLYKFFSELLERQHYSRSDFEEYSDDAINWQQDAVRWDRWETVHDPDNVNTYSAAHGSAFPGSRVSSSPGQNNLHIHSPEQPEFDFKLSWLFMEENIKSGNGSIHDHETDLGRMKVGDYRFQLGEDVFTYTTHTRTGGKAEGETYRTKHTHHTLYLTHQYAPYLYRQLKIVGMLHTNLVYANTAVVINVKEALEDTEESGFLVPLHYPTLKKMGLYKGTQITTANTFIVFNSYERVKIKWYQRGFFKILLVIVIGAASIIFPPLAAAGAATGAALGAGAGLTATLIGAIANSITAMVVSMVVTKAATGIFGEKLGAIIGVIATFVTMQYAMSYLQTGTFAVDWSAMMRAENLLKLTDSVGQAYEGYLQADTLEVYEQMGTIGEEYADEMAKIQELTKDVLGMTNGLIDTTMLTEAEEYFAESSETFLTRTLMTGSDIAELTHALIEDFADISLKLPEAIT